MADRRQLRLLKKGTRIWNEWRARNHDVPIDLWGAGLFNIQLGEINLKGANLEGVDLEEAFMAEANLSDSNLQRAILLSADLRNANLRNASLYGADLRKAKLEKADLRGADLQNSNLQDANLRGADFRGADLRGANLKNATVKNANFDDIDMDSTTSIPANILSGSFAKRTAISAINSSLPSINVRIVPGTATGEEIGELLHEISTLFKMIGGSGITFTPTEIETPEVVTL